MKPAHGEPVSGYSRSEPEAPAAQKVCMKCGTPIPPGSSLCPIHGKFGGGAKLTEGFTPQKDKRFEGEVYRRMMERSSAATQPSRAPAGYTPPEQIYPQMNTPQPAPREAMMQPESAELRICPNCGAQVPDRSKICPNCGNNRLPHQKSGPMLKAEEYYKTRVASVPQPLPAYRQPAEQYYGRPAVQPYEMAQPAPYPEMVARPYPERKGKQKAHKKEVGHPDKAHRQKKSPLPILLALLAVTGVIIISVVLVMDQLQTPQQQVIAPSTTPKTTIATSTNPVISSIQYSDVTSTSALVTWKTDVRSNSLVQYCLDGGVQCQTQRDDALVTEHSLKLPDLQPGTDYHITVISRLGSDPEAAEGSMEATNVLQTPSIQDITPPKITGPDVRNLVSSSSAATATIEWATDEPATSQVKYGTSATYGTSQPEQTDTTLVKEHSVTLNMLPLTATIHYKVVSRDAAGNETSSVDTTFLTPAASGTGLGQLAPDFTLTCTDGSDFTLSSVRGSKAILNFWSINCGPCRDEMPALQQMHDRYPSLPIIAVHANILGSPEDYQIGGYMTDNNLKLTVPIDKVGQVGTLYNITTIPRTFFLDSTGKISKIQDGEFTGGGISAIETMLNSY
jgi:thiol-disulfide isomerase/thioredoxin/RNA polymerase subunit RPABC4/transcription elongation factor Spt4/cytoskeletal protein RodZ